MDSVGSYTLLLTSRGLVGASLQLLKQIQTQVSSPCVSPSRYQPPFAVQPSQTPPRGVPGAARPVMGGAALSPPNRRGVCGRTAQTKYIKKEIAAADLVQLESLVDELGDRLADLQDRYTAGVRPVLGGLSPPAQPAAATLTRSPKLLKEEGRRLASG